MVPGSKVKVESLRIYSDFQIYLIYRLYFQRSIGLDRNTSAMKSHTSVFGVYSNLQTSQDCPLLLGKFNCADFQRF